MGELAPIEGVSSWGFDGLAQVMHMDDLAMQIAAAAGAEGAGSGLWQVAINARCQAFNMLVNVRDSEGSETVALAEIAARRAVGEHQAELRNRVEMAKVGASIRQRRRSWWPWGRA